MISGISRQELHNKLRTRKTIKSTYTDFIQSLVTIFFVCQGFGVE